MDLKKLIEKRNTLIEEMSALADTAIKEERAFTEEETASYDQKKKEVEALDLTIGRCREQRSVELSEGEVEEKLDAVKAEERSFVEYIKAKANNTEVRAETNLTTGANGAVIPTSIANKIIDLIQSICPVYSMADRYTVKGKLSIPYYDETTSAIEVAYATEFAELESTSGKFLSVELDGFLAGALTKISKSLINNSKFDLISYIVSKLAHAFSRWIEKQLLVGTSGKIEGLSGIKNIITAASANAITADELIDVQEAVIDEYQANAIWIMSRKTRAAIRKLKDGDGTYLLQKDATSKWGYSLFGKPVYTSDNMPEIETGKTAIYYGDMSGLAVKVSEDLSVEVLREKFATQHAVGVLGYIEIDAKVQNQQKLSALKMA